LRVEIVKICPRSPTVSLRIPESDRLLGRHFTTNNPCAAKTPRVPGTATQDYGVAAYRRGDSPEIRELLPFPEIVCRNIRDSVQDRSGAGTAAARASLAAEGCLKPNLPRGPPRKGMRCGSVRHTGAFFAGSLGSRMGKGVHSARRLDWREKVSGDRV